MIDKKHNVCYTLHIKCLKKKSRILFLFCSMLVLGLFNNFGTHQVCPNFNMPCCICDMLYGAYKMSSRQPIMKLGLFWTADSMPWLIRMMLAFFSSLYTWILKGPHSSWKCLISLFTISMWLWLVRNDRIFLSLV
jgi:hypothetical protein